MITVVAGTTGELIKLAPLLARLDGDYRLATTAQQTTQIEPLLAEFGLRPPDVWLARGARGRDLDAVGDVPAWLASVARGFVRHRSLLATGNCVVVHGDTMTTALGAVMGRVVHRPVAHVEAGLRSGDLRHPLPEEAIRRVTSRLAAVHYAPGARAARVVEGHGDVVDTHANTLADALALVPPGDPPLALGGGPFGVVSLHRFELLRDRELFAATLETLRASEHELVFVDHPVTAAALRRYGLDAPGRVPRLGFFDWIRLLRRAAFVVSDSGGAQEETYYLDLPCLVHRRRTERVEGLGETAVLSELRLDALAAFLADPGRHRRHTPPPEGSPTALVVDDLRRRGFV
ncbi:MAG TPA: UDP-N-acetylglucosamine 2-epimerase [Gaiellaceae bacterium]|nr:UDP-N-acetylglucosamine 2-epimerase [Gaiellaceae bacterium]